jgi:uncharacterized membrane protein
MSARVSLQSDRIVVLAAYLLHLVGSVTGVISIIGLILNYIRSNQYAESSHHRWMIRTFWWTLLWMAIGVITSVIFIGWGVCFLAWVWYVYRHVRGLIALSNGEPMPA